MNIDDIKQLIDILETSGLESLTYKNQDFEIALQKPVTNTFIPSPSAPAVIAPVNPEPTSATNAMTSPLVGVYYSKPSPDAPEFVKVGQTVKVGDILCIIEAMKVMNEIKATQAGVVKEIYVSEGATVDFDQPLFVIE
ncbi:acetyl-CoA carboxylase biotin carboxyl carrier protein [Erysipelothrix sp. HDW6B]|uniref:acetyl-CoA carboxylase biotin carboxyl carrier protein n=1 Tax=Erysipelothrix TaxID=1647 RepID=UPI00135B5F3A|nr:MULTISPECIES: acetyl-CoA carboxylase biotin carboxyl carrier protein [Erysipelothrix]QIK85661.1 acetyl-CoA carboxylase biotin carboxyl carrier protein [Erysipelothrix sp. HDW6B]